jgi:4-hydroxy-3-methylbut-2-enyl diphosphate reductase
MPEVTTAAVEAPIEAPVETSEFKLPEPVQNATEPPPFEAPKPEPPQRPATENKLSDAQLFEQAMSALEGGDEEADKGGFKKLSKGDRVEATVIQVDKDRVFVDLGTKSEGVVPIQELTDASIEHAQEHVKVGDKIQVVVLRPEGAEGNAVVSKKSADFEEAWDKIEHSFTEGRSINALVVDRVKGGLVVDIGVRGFVPATHVGSGKLRNIEKFVGQNLSLKIIEIDRDRKKVVLSNRQAEEERRVHAKEHIFENVTPGEILDGTVRRLVDYGAFIDLGGVDGL